MKISIIIVALNEDIGDLMVTIATARASKPRVHEIIVVDDGSLAPIKPQIQSFMQKDGLPPVKVVRHDKPRGIDSDGRWTGVQASTGDVFVFLDAHMRLPWDWLGYVMSAVEAFPDSIFTTVCKAFGLHDLFCACGATFNHEYHGGWIGLHWQTRGKVDIEVCPGVLGANYVVPRDVWDSMGGINKGCSGWGYMEQDLSLRAWATGHSVKRLNNVVLLHHFNRKPLPGPRPEGIHMHANLLHVAYALFEDTSFATRLVHYLDPVAQDIFRSQRKIAEEERRRFQPLRQIDDKELHELTGYRVPRADEMESIAYRINQQAEQNKTMTQTTPQWQRFQEQLEVSNAD